VTTTANRLSNDAGPRFIRHYRVVAVDDFDALPLEADSADGVAAAEAAERRLRARLEAGERPEVALVAPERARLAEVDTAGQLLAPAFAWRDAAGDLARAWLHAPHVLAELEANDTTRDYTSDFYAAHGSVVVLGGRLVRLSVTPFLEPVLRQLVTRYGVQHVSVTGLEVPMPDVAPAPALVVNDVLPPASLAMINARFDELLAESEHNQIPGRRGFMRPTVVPPELVPLAGQVIAKVGEHFDLPVTTWQTGVTRYLAGERFGMHTDALDRLPSSLDRTVSFSLVLSRRGVDFDGGDLVVGGQRHAPDAGACVGFTARTPHEVEPVTWGERRVWITFGEVAR